MSLNVKKLHPDATLPTIAHPDSDLGFDLYALEDVFLYPFETVLVRTGIAVECSRHGFLIRDRSSMARKGIITSGGVIDEGYRGEIGVLLTKITKQGDFIYPVKKGDKIAQMLPVLVRTGLIYVQEVNELGESARGENGFGSSGR